MIVGMQKYKQRSVTIEWVHCIALQSHVEVMSLQTPLQHNKAILAQYCQEGGPCPLLYSGVLLSFQPAVKSVPTCTLTVIGVGLQYNFTDTALHSQPEGYPLPPGSNCWHNQFIHISHVWSGGDIKEGLGTGRDCLVISWYTVSFTV